MSPQEFFDTYANWAISTQAKSGIPASITLAQAALESGWGESTLAKTANNYFGIKVAGYPLWFGEYVLAFDVRPNQKFRKYKSVYDSFIDHANFLMLNNRYRKLFETTDYKKWAIGLEDAGYAESKQYAESLIKLIEDYGLEKYDRLGDIEMQTVENTIIRNKYKIYLAVAILVLLTIMYFIYKKFF